MKWIYYIAPEASGEVNYIATVIPPPTHACWGDCKDVLGIYVRVLGLARLPDNSNYYVVVRGGTDTHLEGTYGTPETFKTLKNIAQKYFKRTDGRKLSINDLSLPMGGLFDIYNDWVAPHKTHRTGTDADINSEDGGGVSTNCNDDQHLHKAVKEVAKGQPRPLFDCREGALKHIDFD